MSSELYFGLLTQLEVWAFAIAFVVLFIISQWPLIVIVIKTFPRDVVGASRLIRSYLYVFLRQKSGKSVGDVFETVYKKRPHKICYQSDDERWTFQEVWDRSNQVANYFQSQGYKKGDSIALFMENRPEFVCIWLGLSKLGILSCLVNTNLRLQSLKHSLEIVNCKAVIYGTELSEAVAELYKKELETGGDHLPLFSIAPVTQNGGEKKGNLLALEKRTENLHEQFDKLNVKRTKPVVPKSDRPVFGDDLLCIYTSGTTGLPKAAIVKHSRFIFLCIGYHTMTGLHDNDIFYTCLPLYHSVGGIVGVGQALIKGKTVVIQKKFSARGFWKDCVKFKVTATQSIGEICRYLINQPVTPEESQHSIRTMVTIGLRAEIWTKFVKRFQIPNVVELYSATEGNCSLTNFDNRVGAAGFFPVLLSKFFPIRVFRVDEDTGELVRNPKTGLAVPCKPNEAGELIGKISKVSPFREFNGYANNKEATNKKIVKDVFSKGDMAFRTGDYFLIDELGYYYFKDRAGDTYRWKGENVSTAEVEASISTICGLKDSAVYGVEIPGTNGRAGMVAIADAKRIIDFEAFSTGINKALPSYARPVFVRIKNELELTGTHKLKKTDLQKEGFNVEMIQDPIYFNDGGKYVRLDSKLYQQIINGEIRL